MTYITMQGDMWDRIAYEQMGSESYMGLLIQSNPEFLDYVVFPSGICLTVPEVDEEQTEYPSWRSGLDKEEDDLEEFEEEDA